MNALERLGSYVAANGRQHPSDAVRELVELHLIDTVGALIASTRTVEGLGLLRFRAAMRARGQAEGAWADRNRRGLRADPPGDQRRGRGPVPATRHPGSGQADPRW